MSILWLFGALLVAVFVYLLVLALHVWGDR